MPTVRRCCIVGCMSNSRSNPQLQFFQFPKTDNPFFKLWMQACHASLSRILPFKKPVVCAMHFHHHCLGGRRLTGSAVPTLRLEVPTNLKQVEQQAMIEEIEKSRRCAYINAVVYEWLVRANLNPQLRGSITHGMIKEKAETAKQIIACDSFTADNRWLNRFRESHLSGFAQKLASNQLKPLGPSLWIPDIVQDLQHLFPPTSGERMENFENVPEQYISYMKQYGEYEEEEENDQEPAPGYPEAENGYQDSKLAVQSYFQQQQQQQQQQATQGYYQQQPPAPAQHLPQHVPPQHMPQHPQHPQHTPPPQHHPQNGYNPYHQGGYNGYHQEHYYQQQQQQQQQQQYHQSMAATSPYITHPTAQHHTGMPPQHPAMQQPQQQHPQQIQQQPQQPMSRPPSHSSMHENMSTSLPNSQRSSPYPMSNPNKRPRSIEPESQTNENQQQQPQTVQQLAQDHPTLHQHLNSSRNTSPTNGFVNSRKSPSLNNDVAAENIESNTQITNHSNNSNGSTTNNTNKSNGSAQGSTSAINFKIRLPSLSNGNSNGGGNSNGAAAAAVPQQQQNGSRSVTPKSNGPETSRSSSPKSLNGTEPTTNGHASVCASPKTAIELESYAQALEYLKPLEDFVLFKENFRAIGLISQLETILKKGDLKLSRKPIEAE